MLRLPLIWFVSNLVHFLITVILIIQEQAKESVFVSDRKKIGSKTSQIILTLEETIEEDEETTVDIETKGLHLSPPLSRHIYNAANDHFDLYKHGLERIVRKPIAHWRFHLETVNGIIRFVNSPAITQAVAFGSRLIASPSGQLLKSLENFPIQKWPNKLKLI